MADAPHAPTFHRSSEPCLTQIALACAPRLTASPMRPPSAFPTRPRRRSVWSWRHRWFPRLPGTDCGRRSTGSGTGVSRCPSAPHRAGEYADPGGGSAHAACRSAVRAAPGAPDRSNGVGSCLGRCGRHDELGSHKPVNENGPGKLGFWADLAAFERHRSINVARLHRPVGHVGLRLVADGLIEQGDLVVGDGVGEKP